MYRESNDAEAICEAVTRPTMRFVAIKTVVALANKNARIAWSVITKGTNYSAEHVHS
jgi:hypothetical protein